MSEGQDPVQSTTDVATATFDQLDGADTSGAEDLAESTPVESAPAAPTEAPAPTAQELTDEERLLAEFGFKQAFKPDGREHYIPRSKVLKMIASGLKRGSEKWTTERGTIEQQLKQYKADLDELYSDVRGEPKAFIQKLSQYDQRYAAFLQQQADQREAAQQAQTPSAEHDPEPGPDLDLGNGQRTFSVEGLKKLREWERRQYQRDLDARFKPIQEREQQEKQRPELEQAQRALQERTRSQIAEAQQWPGFTDHEQDILKVLQEDSAKAQAEGRKPTMSLEAAYRQVVLPRLQADRNKMREELLAEINKSAKSTGAVPPTGGEAPSKSAGKTTSADAARRALERLEKAGA